MIRILPFVGAFALPVLLHAQPLIDQGNAPVEGDMFTYTAASYDTITLAGSDVVWDLSDIQPSTTSNLIIEDPAATEYGNLYPTSQIAVDASSAIVYMRSDAAGLYAVGTYKAAGGGIQIQFSDPELVLPYPCTINTAYIDTFAYSYVYNGAVVPGTGVTSFTADGFGTLILPGDTVYNVLKLTGSESTTETFQGGTYNTVYNEVIYYKPGIHYYVLNATDAHVYVNGAQTQAGTFINFLSHSIQGVKETADEAIGIEAWPVPANDLLNITYGLSGGHKVAIVLYDVNGRTMRATDGATSASGIQQSTLDVQGLSPGVYLLKVSDDHGQSGTRRIVIQ